MCSSDLFPSHDTPGQRGINYKITDKSKVVTSPAADVETFDGFFIIHTEKGPVNTIYPKLTYAQLVDVFGDINPEKHGLHTLAAYNFANAGNTVTVIRVDKDAKLANMTTKIKLTALEKEVLIYKGTIINASEADITAGMHNEIFYLPLSCWQHFQSAHRGYHPLQDIFS